MHSAKPERADLTQGSTRCASRLKAILSSQIPDIHESWAHIRFMRTTGYRVTLCQGSFSNKYVAKLMDACARSHFFNRERDTIVATSGCLPTLLLLQFMAEQVLTLFPCHLKPNYVIWRQSAENSAKYEWKWLYNQTRYLSPVCFAAQSYETAWLGIKNCR